MLSILIADDEIIARKTLKLLVNEHVPSANICIAKDGAQALKIISDRHIDIAFLDIQMPVKTGLEIAQSVGKNTAIIFVTAYDQFAIDAFTLNAIDYLLKPVADTRFARAIEKAYVYLRASKETQNQKQETIQQTVSTLLNQNKKLVLKEVGKIKIINQQDIKFISGAGNYIEIHFLRDKTIVQRETLASIEKKLDPALFSRIHKSTIIRNELVIELRPTHKGDYVIKLKTGEEVVLSRRNKDKLDGILN